MRILHNDNKKKVNFRKGVTNPCIKVTSKLTLSSVSKLHWQTSFFLLYVSQLKLVT